MDTKSNHHLTKSNKPECICCKGLADGKTEVEGKKVDICFNCYKSGKLKKYIEENNIE